MFVTELLHPAVVHFPITLLLVASGAALAYLFLWPRAELRLAAWWSMALGWLATAVAVGTGLVAQAGLPVDAPWRRTLNLHIGTGLALLVSYGALLYMAWLHKRPRRRAGSVQQAGDLLEDRSRRWLVAALLVLGGLLVIATGFYGGELVYLWGVNVGN